MCRILNFKFETLISPLRTTFATSLGSKTTAKSVIITVVLEDGSIGIGEVPTSFVLPHETLEAITAALSEFKQSVLNRPSADYAFIASQFRNRWPELHMSASGLEVALFRAYLQSQGKTEHNFWGSKLDRIETDITVPFVPEVQALSQWLGNAVKTGFRVYKIKISGNIEQDFSFVKTIAGFLADSVPDYIIRLDGNQGFTVESSLELLEKLERASISTELFEQPLRRDDYAGLKALCRRCPVPVIADETVFGIDDCRRVIDNGLAHGINIKIAKSGISNSEQIFKAACEANMKLMIGCMTETMVGLSAAIMMAGGTGGFDYIDLDSVHFMQNESDYRCPITQQGRFFEIKGS